ncbi:XPG (rad-related) exonuclease [Cryptosporidium ryanae]|uniref:XPG (rad-related) exonuclease n=1 Tax=Cryptosporidium ryanae TaxID=515981 RepID=UPI00351A810C|nr:XPG (rad-related) exonuclease [Cryptosporidium ryanae]
MGIQGLLPNVENVCVKGNISSFKGKRIAIDTYCWLHRSAANCAESLVLGRPTRMHINYCVDRVTLLQSKGITPICVFDGAALPMKKVTEEERHKKRMKARNEIAEMKRKKTGNSYIMKNLCQKALDITPDIAYQVLEVLRDTCKIECIVAPYEADAQLSYLSRKGYVDAVLTEDSDMLVFGSKCTIYKYDDKTGSCKIINWNDLYNSGLIPKKMFNYETFVLGCILTGCDYVKSPQGVGIKTAMKLTQECNANLEKIISQLQELGKHVPTDYSESVQRALITFFHQTVFDPVEQKMVPLSESKPPIINGTTNVTLSGVPIFLEFNRQMSCETRTDFDNTYDFIGPIIKGDIGKKICMGILHPESKIEYKKIEERTELNLQDAIDMHEDQINSRNRDKNTRNDGIKENLSLNFTFEAEREFEIEKTIKKSIKFPVFKKLSKTKFNIEHGNELDIKKKRRAIWLNSEENIESRNQEINLLNSLAFNMV